MSKSLPLIPDEYFLLIGQIAAVWSRIEYILQCTVVSLLCEKDQAGGMLLTANVGYQSRIQLVQTFCSTFKESEPDTVKPWMKMLEGLNAAYADRNAFVHGLWSRDDPNAVPSRLVLRAKGRLTLVAVPTELSAARAALQQIQDAEAELLRLADEMKIELGNRQALGLP